MHISSDALISKLPQELWFTIFSHLPFRALLRVEASCQCFRQLVVGHQLYKASYTRLCQQQGMKPFLLEILDQEAEPLDSCLLSRFSSLGRGSHRRKSEHYLSQKCLPQ